jgi:hypothetical protein
VNSEELELSLRAEFESYLKGFLADLRREVSEFQKSFETEFEKHKAQTDEALRKLVGRFDTGVHFDQAFNESVIEHLRLARDEGATITAVAIGEAEKLKEASAPAVEFDKLRDAINEISSKASQSEILKALVDNASHFAPRGAFFIVKNEHFVGWRAFGNDARVDEATVRGVQFPISADTVLAESIATLHTATANSSSHADDDQFLSSLDLGNPDRMYAIPLVARGRGVAVLYADYGTEGVSLNPEALETLVRVAGLTVELAAAAIQPVAVPQHVEGPAVEKAPEPEYHAPEPGAQEPAVEETPADEIESAADEYLGVREFEHADVDKEAPVEAEVQEVQPAFEQTETGFEAVVDEETAPAAVEEYSFEPVAEPAVQEEVAEPVEAVNEYIPVERFGEMVVEEAEKVTYFETVEEKEEVVAEPTFVQPEEIEEYIPVEAVEEFPDVIEEPAAAPVAEYVPHVEQPAEAVNGSAAPTKFEPAAEVATEPATRTKYRDRNVDLPIEVPDEERRLHNDARRFARLLVSEIKLYNEQKVADGRQSGDLYDRLREAIDRSRDMYDKRVQQPVAEKFDYFHYELVNSLAEGEDVKLGASYPGSKVPA